MRQNLLSRSHATVQALKGQEFWPPTILVDRKLPGSTTVYEECSKPKRRWPPDLRLQLWAVFSVATPCYEPSLPAQLPFFELPPSQLPQACDLGICKELSRACPRHPRRQARFLPKHLKLKQRLERTSATNLSAKKKKRHGSLRSRRLYIHRKKMCHRYPNCRATHLLSSSLY